MRRTTQNDYKKLIPLKRIAEASSYSPGYVSILVQRKKLKAKKIGNKYYSTKEWLDQYLNLHGREVKKLPAEAIKILSSGRAEGARAASPAAAVANLKKQAGSTGSPQAEPAVELKAGEIFLAEILNSKIEAPEAKLIANLEEPEKTLDNAWESRFIHEAKELFRLYGAKANKIKIAARRQTLNYFAEKIKNIFFAFGRAAVRSAEILSQGSVFKAGAISLVMVYCLLIFLNFLYAEPDTNAKYLIQSGRPINQVGIFYGQSNISIQASSALARIRAGLDQVLISSVNYIDTTNLKLKNNIRHRNRVLAKRAASLKGQLWFIGNFWRQQYDDKLGALISGSAGKVAGIKLVSEGSPDKAGQLNQAGAEASGDKVGLGGTRASGGQGKVAGAIEIKTDLTLQSSLNQAPLSRFLALADTASHRGQEVIDQVKYNTVKTLENTANRQVELSFSLGQKFASLTKSVSDAVDWFRQAVKIN